MDAFTCIFPETFWPRVEVGGTSANLEESQKEIGGLGVALS